MNVVCRCGFEVLFVPTFCGVILLASNLAYLQIQQVCNWQFVKEQRCRRGSGSFRKMDACFGNGPLIYELSEFFFENAEIFMGNGVPSNAQ